MRLRIHLTSNTALRYSTRPGVILLACYLLLVCISVLVTGYGSWISNHAMQMPLVDILRDPRLYPNDAFVKTLHDYPVLLWRVVAPLGGFIKMEHILLGGFVLTRVLMIAAAWMLASTLVPRSRTAALFAMAFMAMAPRPIIGGGTIMPNYFEQTGLAMPVYLMAMSAFLAQRRYTCALVLATAVYLNIMYGIFFVVYLVFFAISERSFFLTWRRWVGPALLTVLLVLPLAPYTLAAMHPTPYDLDAWLKVNLIRAPHHMDPLAWRAERWLRIAALAAICLCVTAWCRRTYPVIFRLVASATSACVFWTALSFAARFSRSPSLLTLHSARGTDFFYCLAGIATAALIAAELEQKPDARNGLILAPAMLALVPQPWYGTAAPFLLAGFAAVALVLSRPSRVQFHRAAAILIAAVLAWGIAQMGSRDWRIIQRHDKEVAEIADWGKKKTPVDAVFLINPTWDDFRALAQRSVYLTWKDGGALPWSRPFARLWLDRLDSLGISNPDKMKHSELGLLSDYYERLDDQSVARIAQRTRLDYWVIDKNHPTTFRTILQCKKHKVVEIKQIPGSP